MTDAGNGWEIPPFTSSVFKPKGSKYAVLIPVLNEGERIRRQLEEMTPLSKGQDTLMVDGGSTDGSLEPAFLRRCEVRTLLVETGRSGVGAQLRAGFAYALREGYEGIVLIDGNHKDNWEAIPSFISELEKGFDHIQGSRFLKNGRAVNTPLTRLLGIKLLHAPSISLASGFRYTDTTNGFRAYSRRFLLDKRVQPFRKIFTSYELHYYLAIRAARLGFRVKEVPVTRAYPDEGPIPTKIRFLKGNLHMLKLLIQSCLGRYNPPST